LNVEELKKIYPDTGEVNGRDSAQKLKMHFASLPFPLFLQGFTG
jgi:hypothetical protein